MEEAILDATQPVHQLLSNQFGPIKHGSHRLTIEAIWLVRGYGHLQKSLVCSNVSLDFLLKVGDRFLAHVISHAFGILTRLALVVANLESLCCLQDLLELWSKSWWPHVLDGRVPKGDRQLVIAPDHWIEDMHLLRITCIWNVGRQVVHDTCRQAILCCAILVLQALQSDAKATLEVVPEPKDMTCFMHDNSFQPCAQQLLQFSGV
mmetsp:Transcript_5082/g.8493  ORF Transcript_5082/g.8493 Transcript_5082/m.8493 type:complete len:206 (-) Transcript_5082:741-1358(-)